MVCLGLARVGTDAMLPKSGAHGRAAPFLAPNQPLPASQVVLVRPEVQMVPAA